MRNRTTASFLVALVLGWAWVPNLTAGEKRPNVVVIVAGHEGTVDGSHPTDLGFQRQAEAFAKVLEPLVR